MSSAFGLRGKKNTTKREASFGWLFKSWESDLFPWQLAMQLDLCPSLQRKANMPGSGGKIMTSQMMKVSDSMHAQFEYLSAKSEFDAQIQIFFLFGS